MIKPIRNDDDHRHALGRIDDLWDCAPGSPEADELEVLSMLVDAYESTAHPIEPPDPIELIRYVMEQRGLKARDLESIFGASGRTSEVLNRKRPLTLGMIRKLVELDIPADVLVREYEIVR